MNESDLFEQQETTCGSACRWLRERYCGEGKLSRRLPPLAWTRTYSWGCLKGDIIAGISVAFTLVPQALAMALLAGVPIQYGLYSSFVGPFVYALFGSCKDITVGPTSIMAIMTAGYALEGGVNYALLLAFLAGCVQLLCGLLNLGFLVDFISFPVISGFSTAAATTILFAQLKAFFGLTSMPRKVETGSKFIDDLANVVINIDGAKFWDTFLAVICLTLLVSMKLLLLRSQRKKRDFVEAPVAIQNELLQERGEKLPLLAHPIRSRVNEMLALLLISRNAIVVIFCGLLTYSLGAWDPFMLTQTISPGLPSFALPNFTQSATSLNASHPMIAKNFPQILHDLTPGFVSVALLSLLESVAIAKSFEVSAGSGTKKLDSTQEMIALGFSNILGSCFGSFPVTGSFTRSAIAHNSGVKTPFSGIITGSIVLLSLSAYVAPYFHFIPQSTLASVIIAAVVFLIKPQDVLFIWKSNRLDLIPYFITLVASVAFGLEVGILFGVIFSILLLLYSMTRPKLYFERKWIKCRTSDPRVAHSGEEPLYGFPYLLVKPNQSIFYLSVEYLKTKIWKELETSSAMSSSSSSSLRDMNVNENKFVILLDATHIFACDSSFVLGINQFLGAMQRKGILVICHRMRANIVDSLNSLSLTSSRGLLYFSHTDDQILDVIQSYYSRIDNPT